MDYRSTASKSNDIFCSSGDYKNQTGEGENQTETIFPELFHPNTRNHAQVQQEISEAQARGADRLGDGRKGG